MKILIADDHTIVREGIKLLLMEALPGAEVVDVVDSASLLKLVYKEKWDVIITDISMPPGDSGLEAVKKIKEYSPSTPVIVFSMHSPDQYAVRAMRAGAAGYLTKSAAALELVNAVKQVKSGKRYISDDVAIALASAFDKKGMDRSIESLSDRELEVFKLLAVGKSVSEIAHELILSINTINTFRGRLLDKLNFQNNMQLIRFAVDNRLV
ncbi:response regulator [Sediminibacterium soli]|uniref:response regulator n=1 Tax=Sediminibacterium soli TaxID=2698829 RepID=UPI001379AE92|nr:response regulator transcription factor [Sediminibacterium soli]NCI46601.1 response regulator transcription factor [Sediminibacterium soli]